MTEKNVQEAKIRKGSPARNPVCYQTTRDIVILAGTILRDNGEHCFAAEMGVADVGYHVAITLEVDSGAQASPIFKKVIA